MKIVFIGGRDIHQLGGIENYMLNLATKLVVKGHIPIIYCESDKNSVEWFNGFKVIHQKSIGGRFLCKPLLGFMATFKTLINEKGVDLIHYNAWPPSIWSWLPQLFGISTLMQGHGLEWQRTKYSRRQQKVMKFMEMLTAHMNKNLIMVSEDQTKYFLEKYGKKCITIPTAVNVPRQEYIKSDIFRKFSICPNRYFLFLGRLVQDKNPDYLIKAFKLVDAQNCQLVIAGANDSNSNYVSYLKKIAEGYSNIVFTGAVYGVDKEALLQNCLAFCIPSTIEGLSITLLEAMSYKRIIIASQISANKEVLHDNALWVTPENVEELAEKLSLTLNGSLSFEYQAASNYNLILGKYTWDKVSEQYLRYCSTIIKYKYH